MADNPASTQLRRGVVGPCILALLSTAPRFGLQIVRELNEVGQLLTSQGTVYPLLARLQEAGQVSSHWEVSDTERPRRYYSLTDVGRRDLELFREDWRQFSDSVGSLLETVPSAVSAMSRPSSGEPDAAKMASIFRITTAFNTM